MNTQQKIEAWIGRLTDAQKDELILDLVAEHINSENIRFPDAALSPYWIHSGDPIVAGQQTYPEDD